ARQSLSMPRPRSKTCPGASRPLGRQTSEPSVSGRRRRFQRVQELAAVGRAPPGAGIPARSGPELAIEQATRVVVAVGDGAQHAGRPEGIVEQRVEITDAGAE